MNNLTYKEGLEITKKYNMEAEYNMSIEMGNTPLQALMEWDLI